MGAWEEGAGGFQGRWRELSAAFREAGRCSHGNHRPVTSLKKKKDKLGDFVCCLDTLCREAMWRFGEGCRRLGRRWVDVRSRSPRGEGVIQPIRKRVDAPPCGPQDLQALASSADASPSIP